MSWPHLLKLRAHVLDMKLDPLLCWQPFPVSRGWQGVHVKRQQLRDVVIGRPVLQPQLCFPEPVALHSPTSKVGMDRVQW